MALLQEETYFEQGVSSLVMSCKLQDLPNIPIPTEFALRVANDEDAPALAGLLRSAFPNSKPPWSVERVNSALLKCEDVPKTFVIIEKCSDAIVSTASPLYVRGTDDVSGAGCHVHWVATSPAHRGHKLGAAATIQVANFFVEEGRECVGLLTQDFRAAAVKVYWRLGFRPVLTDGSHEERWRVLKSLHNLNDSVE